MAKRASVASPRRHWTEADARRVLAEWERSGDSLEAFARSRGLVPQRLAWWKKRLRAARPETSTALTFVPAAVTGGAPASTATPAAAIRLPHGIVNEIDGVSPAWVVLSGAVERDKSNSWAPGGGSTSPTRAPTNNGLDYKSSDDR